MLLVWIGDIAAFYVGRAIGKHKLAPRVSPGKTWEGAIASVIAAVVVAIVLLFHFLRLRSGAGSAQLHLVSPSDFADHMRSLASATPDFLAPMVVAAASRLCVNVAAQLGDLVESALKRGRRREGLRLAASRARRRARPH